jgi:hypothetical protein
MTKTQRLDLAVRDDGSNLFARLCPSVAQGLHADACHELEKASIHSKADVWKVQKSSIEFLPIEISFQGTTIFTSYNGGSLSELGTFYLHARDLSHHTPMIDSVWILSLPLNYNVEIIHCCLPSEVYIATCTMDCYSFFLLTCSLIYSLLL